MIARPARSLLIRIGMIINKTFELYATGEMTVIG